MYITLATLDYYDTVTSAPATLYYATGGYTSSGASTPPNTFFDARIKRAGRITRSMFGNGTTRGDSVVSRGEMVVRNGDGGLDAIRNYAFDGRTYTEYYGQNTATFPGGFTKTLVATFDGQPEFASVDEVRFRLRDRSAETRVPLQTTKYAGDNVLPDGVEGVSDLKDKPKPWLFGSVFNIAPPCVNTSKLIYQIHDGAIDVPTVRDRGVELTYGGFYDNLSELLDDGLAPAAGEFKALLVSGYIRLGSTPDGLVTCDAATSSLSAGQGFAAVMSKIGLGSDYSTSDVTALDVVRAGPVSFWAGPEDNVMANEVLDWFAGSAEAWWGPDYVGVYRIKLGPDETATPVLTVTSNDLLGLRLLPTNDEGNGRPAYRVSIRYNKNYTVQDTDLASGVALADRAAFSRPWLVESATAPSVQTAFALAQEIIIETGLTVDSDVAAMAARLGARYDSRQDLIEFPLPITPETGPEVLTLDLGQVVRVLHDRFGLSAGRNFAIVTIDRNPQAGKLLIQGYAAA